MNQTQRILVLFLFLSVTIGTCIAKPKKVKISVSPADTQIFIDGNYVGNDVVEVSFDKSDFLAIRLEKEGYLTQESKVYKSDKRTAVSYTMRIDKFYEASVPSGLVNKFFSVTVSPDYYTVDKKNRKERHRESLETYSPDSAKLF